jgi:hypothetical protein
MAKKILPPLTPEPDLETRRDVMKLSLAVAAFGAAMGMAGPSLAEVKRRREGPKGAVDHGLTDRKGGPKGGGRDKIDTGRSKGPKERDKHGVARRRGPKEKMGEDTGRKEGPKGAGESGRLR